MPLFLGNTQFVKNHKDGPKISGKSFGQKYLCHFGVTFRVTYEPQGLWREAESVRE
jgi:hypothetical protein